MSEKLHERWEITGPDSDNFVWLNLEGDGEQSHINLGLCPQAAEKLANWLAATDFGE